MSMSAVTIVVREYQGALSQNFTLTVLQLQSILGVTQTEKVRGSVRLHWGVQQVKASKLVQSRNDMILMGG